MLILFALDHRLVLAYVILTIFMLPKTVEQLKAARVEAGE